MVSFFGFIAYLNRRMVQCRLNKINMHNTQMITQGQSPQQDVTIFDPRTLPFAASNKVSVQWLGLLFIDPMGVQDINQK